MKIFETGFLRLFVHDSYKSLFDNLYNIRGIANIYDCIFMKQSSSTKFAKISSHEKYHLLILHTLILSMRPLELSGLVSDCSF